jgi:hypothetical protein
MDLKSKLKHPLFKLWFSNRVTQNSFAFSTIRDYSSRNIIFLITKLVEI